MMLKMKVIKILKFHVIPKISSALWLKSKEPISYNLLHGKLIHLIKIKTIFYANALIKILLRDTSEELITWYD